MALVEQIGDEMLTKLIEVTGLTKDQVSATVIMIGLPTMDYIRARIDQRFPGNPEVSDLFMEVVMLGFGWSALATFHGLTIDYVKMLDELNDMKIKDDNDLPPTKEKG
jgi:hypothetical protein